MSLSSFFGEKHKNKNRDTFCPPSFPRNKPKPASSSNNGKFSDQDALVMRSDAKPEDLRYEANSFNSPDISKLCDMFTSVYPLFATPVNSETIP